MTSPATVLVTGGAGYIGSHAVLALLDAGHEVVVLDDLSTGVRALVADEARFVEGASGDRAVLEALFGAHNFDAVMHFAGSIIVYESVVEPLHYYRNNVAGSLELIDACARHDVGAFVFSSSAAVYGIPEQIPVPEEAALVPISPYGWSKRMIEQVLGDAEPAGGPKYAALRYFNVAGADPKGRSGESVPVASHLIKIAAQVVAGRRQTMQLFGDDYPTPDGTCIRDYIHVSDLADIHVRALARLLGGGDSFVCNCGYGRGLSNREVLTSVGVVIGRPFEVAVGPRRPGDPPVLISSVERLGALLEWRPQFDRAEEIIRSAIDWERHLAKTGLDERD